MTMNIPAFRIRPSKLRAAVETLGAAGLVTAFALLIWAPDFVFGDRPVAMRPIQVASRCAHLR